MEHNVAARAGRWSASHRKTAIWGWLVFVALAVFVGGAVGTKTLTNAQSNVGEAGRADRTVDDSYPKRANETVLIQNNSEKASGSFFRAAVLDVQQDIAAVPHVREVQGPYAPGNEGQISSDGHSALINFKVNGDDNQAKDRVGAVLGAVGRAKVIHGSFTIGEFGDASSDKQLSKAFEDDFRKAETTSLPVTLVILLIAFGALVAAGVPLLLALTAVGATIGLIGPLSHLAAVDESINSVILLIGLAVGVDYSMFYLRREREERAAGKDPRTALQVAAATSGRSVIISGLTVMIAMSGMYLAGAPTFQSFATGTIIVVAVAVVGSITVLPAVLAWLGDRVEKGRVPFLNRIKGRIAQSGLWSRTVDRVLRRPLISMLVAGGLLVFLATPTLGMHTATPGVDTLPQDLPVIKTYNRIQEAFPGGPIPAEVVISAPDVTAPEVRTAVAELRTRTQESTNFDRPIITSVNPAHTVMDVSIPVAGDGTDARSNAALAELRDSLIPATIGKVPGASADVGGYTASSKDFNDIMKARAPLVFLLVLTAAFILLLVTFRSIVIPLKAILLNLLSVGAAYGIIVWIFQDGHFESLLGFKSNGAIVSWLPLFLFVVLFGLSMDYHVFILTRIREGYDRGMSTADAVSHGIKTTAGVVTSAAVVMVSVFAIFATLSLLIFKELGIGLAIAVLIDATIIRGVLLPATMKLLGDWNWYLPSWLEWLPKISRGAEAPRRRPTGAEPGARPTEA